MFNFDSVEKSSDRMTVKLFANLVLFKALADDADEIILTLKSRAECIGDEPKDASSLDGTKKHRVKSIPEVKPQSMAPTPKTKGEGMEAIIEAAKKAGELEARASGVPIVENPQVMELVYVIPGKGRVRLSPPPPVFVFSPLIWLLLLNANIPFLRALFLRAGIPYWNHGPVEGTFQIISTYLSTHNSLWKLESADTRRELRLIRLRSPSP